MNWVPVVFIIFKVGVLAIGMFFSIKWHYDQDKSPNPVNIKRIVLEATAYVVAVILVFSLLYSLFHYLKLLPAGLDFY